jgi:hypothetical protein
MLLSVERPIVGAFALRGPGATLLHCIGLVQAVLPASREHVQTDNRDFPRTWEILHVSSADSRLELPGDQLQASAVHSSAGERKQRVEPRYRQAKATKRGGMDGRKSQHPHSTDEAGELVPQDPVEGRKNRKGVPDVGTWAGKYVRGFVLGTAYHRHDPG